MYGVATSLPKDSRNLTAGGNRMRYPNAAPAMKARRLAGSKVNRYRLSVLFSPGAANIATW